MQQEFQPIKAAPTSPPATGFKGMRQEFKPNCRAFFSGLEDGAYRVALYMIYSNTDGTLDSGSAEYSRQKLVSKDEVTIFKGNQETVKFKSK
jgi:hypothetical protein